MKTEIEKEEQGEIEEKALSKLELKLRRKIQIIGYNPKKEEVRKRHLEILKKCFTVKKIKYNKEAPISRNDAF
jgi:hypothetical protein